MDGQISELFSSGLQKLEFGRCSCFLPGRAKDLSARRYIEMCLCKVLVVLSKGARSGAVGPGTALLAGMLRDQ